MRDEAASRFAVHTTDFDATVNAMEETFGSIALEPAGDVPPELILRSAQLQDLTSARWTLKGVDGGRRGEAPEPTYLTGILIGGHAEMWSWREEIDVTRPFFYPEPVDARLSEPDVANLGVSRSVVQAHARAMTGRDDFEARFTDTAPVDPTMDRVWRDTIAFTARTAEALAEQADGVLAHAQLIDLVATLLLRTFPNTTLDAENQRDVNGPRGVPLRRALQYMHDHLAEPISILDIAEAARLSPRGLHAPFRRDLGTTPMAHLRQARLAAAHDELRASDPERTSVAAVALHWGFVDTARFRARYIARFEQSPEDTLRL